ncbi:hypothetical protein L13192_10385 [Pyrenophora tritici-repentis]|uniref:RanBP2-type domain-containing protein n=1 Tax=Pyrenophora tritici-repentis TaxID=45151 RepID=A0A922NB04_9PLEO|nr:hypothetical protein Ptr86124_008597 [Pyrenophora tritici-repentis]KAI1665444.1 hypothetical protein L13192_10385 [Pyrenophora tritici-repentis]KAI1677739.1 hypothetical protein KJE20_12675 [Pyrenophora tritici-repentis]
MPQWLCQECRWPNEEAAETCTQCNQLTCDGTPGMTDGSSSEEEEEEEEAQTPMSDEVPQEYQSEEDNEDDEEE